MQHSHRLTPGQAKKLALVTQCLPQSGFSRGIKGTYEAIKHLGYVQIDTISVVERAHHHTLWNRVPHYRHRYPDRLIEQREIFEYWSHAAAYLPFEDFRFCLPRMQAIKKGQHHWYKKNHKVMKYILERISLDGALQARDFEEHKGFNGGMWEWGPIKQAIEHLFMQGDLLITKRQSFQKVFDLAERVIPSHVNTQAPSKQEFAHYLINRYLNSNGIGHLTEFAYLRKGMGPSIKQAVNEKLESGEIVEIKINKRNEQFYTFANYEHLLAQRQAKLKAKILSPFDNLVIQRNRIKRLFDYDYQLECYLPANKRTHGYFTLPILWGGELVARMDAKADRKNGVFIIRNLVLESRLKQQEKFASYFCTELNNFVQFNSCSEIKVTAKINASVRQLLKDCHVM